MADIELGDPDDLSEEEWALVEELQEADQEEFDRHIRELATHPTPRESDLRVLRHPSIIEDAESALVRLNSQAQSQQLAATRRGHGRERMEWHLEAKRLGTIRKHLRKYVNLAISEAAQGSVRHRAERVLGRALPVERKRIERDIEAGMSVPEAEKAFLARRKG